MAGEPPERQNKWQYVALGGSRWNPVQGLGSLWLSPLLDFPRHKAMFGGSKVLVNK